MLNILGSLALAYVAGSGTVTNTSIMGRGLFRSACRAVQGEFKEAAVEAASALTAPALMSYASIAAMVVDIADGAFALIEPALEEASLPRYERAA